jgi:hypothetical protein
VFTRILLQNHIWTILIKPDPHPPHVIFFPKITIYKYFKCLNCEMNKKLFLKVNVAMKYEILLTKAKEVSVGHFVVSRIILISR